MLRTGLKFAANGDAAASLLADIFNENRHRPRAVVDIEKQRAVEAPKTEAPTPDLSQLDDIRGALAGQYDAPIRLDPMPAPEPAMKVEAALLAAAQEELAAAQEALAAVPKPDDLVVPSAVMRGQERLKTADEETVLRAAALIAARRMEAIGPSPPPPKPPTPKPVNPENTVPEDKPGEKPLDAKSRQKWHLATMAFSKAWAGRAKKEEQRLQAKPLDDLVQEKPIKTAAHKPLAEDSKKGRTETSKSRQARVQEAAKLGLGSHASGTKGQHNSQVSRLCLSPPRLCSNCHRRCCEKMPASASQSEVKKKNVPLVKGVETGSSSCPVRQCQAQGSHRGAPCIPPAMLVCVRASFFLTGSAQCAV